MTFNPRETGFTTCKTCYEDFFHKTDCVTYRSALYAMLERYNNRISGGDTIICPHCLHHVEEPYEYDLPRDDDEDMRDMECPECERTFLACKRVEITYETKKKPDHD